MSSEVNWAFEELLLENQDFDKSLLSKDEDGNYENEKIESDFYFFQAGIEFFNFGLSRIVKSVADPVVVEKANELGPIEVIRDENGFWAHPVLDQYISSVLGGHEQMTDLDFKKMSAHFNVRFTEIEMDWDCSQELADRYWVEGDVGAVKNWNPTVPSGDGWFLSFINETAAGPVAWWCINTGDYWAFLKRGISSEVV